MNKRKILSVKTLFLLLFLLNFVFIMNLKRGSVSKTVAAPPNPTINICDLFAKTQGNSMSTDEYFFFEGSCGGAFKLCKNRDCSAYQEYLVDGGYIKFVLDNTWATGPNQDIMCQEGQGAAAMRIYDGTIYPTVESAQAAVCHNDPKPQNAGKWSPLTMTLGGSFETPHLIKAFQRSNLEACCSAQYEGLLTHSIVFTYYGCVDFGSFVLDNVAILQTGQEQWYLDDNYGWVGWDMPGAGNYVTGVQGQPVQSDNVIDKSRCIKAENQGRTEASVEAEPERISWNWLETPEKTLIFYIPEEGNEDLRAMIQQKESKDAMDDLPLPDLPPGTPGNPPYSPGGWRIPLKVNWCISSDCDDHLSRRSNCGWDFITPGTSPANYGVPVYPIAPGIVEYAGCAYYRPGTLPPDCSNPSCKNPKGTDCVDPNFSRARGYGCLVIIAHFDSNNNLIARSRYAHLYACGLPQVGTIVGVPDQNGNISPIGYMDNSGWSTGHHLHFEFHNDTGAILDPQEVFKLYEPEVCCPYARNRYCK